MKDSEKAKSIFIKKSAKGILMLHGFTASPNDFRHYADRLSSQRYTVSVPLLKGHGTDVEDLHRVNWYDWFSDVKRAYFQLNEHCQKIVVLGQSIGGTLALHLASHYKTDGLVLLAPGLFFKNKATRAISIISKVKKYIDKTDGPDIMNPVSRRNAVGYTKIPTQSINEVARLFKHVKEDLAEVSSPVLIFHSIKDHVIEYKSSEYIYKNISSKKKRLQTLYNSYHVLSLDNEKNIILKEIESFVKVLFSQ